jgi:hypothetical protein
LTWFIRPLRRVNGITLVAEDEAGGIPGAGEKAATCPRCPTYGWLHRHTGFVASTLMRSETAANTVKWRLPPCI